MKSKTVTTYFQNVFSNRDTLQTCIPKGLREKAGIKKGSKLASVVCDEDRTVQVKKGTILTVVVETPKII